MVARNGSDGRFPEMQQPTSSKPAKVIDFHFREGIAGTVVRYPCPRCAEPLVSPIGDAGAVDNCPSCAIQFEVPGTERKIELEKRRKHVEELKQKAALTKRDVDQQRREQQTARTVELAASKADVEKQVQLDRDPLKEWYWQFALAMILLIVAAGRHMVTAVTSDETYLCVVIYGLFIVGIVVNYLCVRQLRIEYVCAAVCMQKLRMKNGLVEVMNTRPAGVFHRHVQDLGNIAKLDDNFTQDRLITLLYSRLMAKARIVEILSNVLVSLGLIGTILGLITMTQGLNGTLESLSQDDNSQLLTGMRNTMSGLGTAFYTTLVGAILGSVVLRILNNVYTSNVDHLVSYVASTAEVKIVPRLKQLVRLQTESKA